jgi:hypothetical protein
VIIFTLLIITVYISTLQKGTIREARDGALQSTYITTTLARVLRSSAQRMVDCPSVSFGMLQIWQEFKAWSSGVHVGTAALTKDTAGPASCVFYAEWVPPHKDMAERVQELNNRLAAAIQLLNNETGGQSMQLGSVAAIMSIPICPSSNDVDMDMYKDNGSEEDD